MKKAFTLIELLIVVAIIAILAAIAVPNFLEAQTRSKVSRVKNDLRSYATAIEAYTVDNNKPPREFHATHFGDVFVQDGQVVSPSPSGIVFPGLSSPIAYITTTYQKDVFQDKNLNAALDEQFFSYHDLKWKQVSGNYSEPFISVALDFYGMWRMISVGPDRRYGHGFVNSAQLVYDPTNGTISLGNIFRSHKLSSDVQPKAGGSGFLITEH
jgi:prepilin-type N-terminal cleavage/methylation domain-containing protein